MANSYLEDMVLDIGRPAILRYIDGIHWLMDDFRSDLDTRSARSSWVISTSAVAKVKALVTELTEAGIPYASEALRYRCFLNAIDLEVLKTHDYHMAILGQWNYASTAVNLAGGFLRLDTSLRQFNQILQAEKDLLGMLQKIHACKKESDVLTNDSLEFIIGKCTKELKEHKALQRSAAVALTNTKEVLVNLFEEVVDPEKDALSSQEPDYADVTLRMIGLHETTYEPDSALECLIGLSYDLGIPTVGTFEDGIVKVADTRKNEIDQACKILEAHLKERMLAWQTISTWQSILADEFGNGEPVTGGNNEADELVEPVVDTEDSAP